MDQGVKITDNAYTKSCSIKLSQSLIIEEPPLNKGRRIKAIKYSFLSKLGANQFALVLLIAMGVHCDINLRKPADGSFVTGSIVSGVARYTVDEDTVFTKIEISLNGRGNLDVHNLRKKDEADGMIKDEEEYVNEDIVVLNDKRGHVLPTGSYETQFYFKFPLNIPPTLDLIKSAGSYTVRCRISYYLRIKFKSPEGNKHFSMTINVNPGINPRLSTEPRTYDKQRKLIQLLRDSLVTVKATINNPVVSPGGKVSLNYEIFNDTNVDFKSVESKLVGVTYFPKGHYDSKFTEEVITDINTVIIKSGESRTFDVEKPIPKDVNSIENSQLIARDYFVKIIVFLPLPYRNVPLKVPLQIGGVIEERFSVESEEVTSSWEEIAEDETMNPEEDL